MSYRSVILTTLITHISVTSALHAGEQRYDGLLLDGDIGIAVQPNGTVVATWQTLWPTPDGPVYVGMVPAGAEVGAPSWRFTYLPTETSNLTTSHSISLELGWWEVEGIDIDDLVGNGGGTLHLRFEIPDPEYPTTRFTTTRLFHTRFAYRRDSGEEYRRVPCISLGPVVDLVTDSTAVISWEQDMPSDWLLTHSGSQTISGTATDRASVELIDLPVDSDIEYQVELIDPVHGLPLPARSHTFHTAPSLGSLEPFRFAVMSDSQMNWTGSALTAVEDVNWSTLERVMLEAHRGEASFVLFLGDLINGYTVSPHDFERQLRSWRRVVDPIAASIPVYECKGNHEAVGPEPGPILHSFADHRAPEILFSQNFINPSNGPGPEHIDSVEGPPYGETVYSFDWGNAHVAILNSNYWWKNIEAENPLIPGNRDGFLMDGQLAWLEADLIDARARGMLHLFVACHEPIFPNGGHLGDGMYWDGEIPEVLEMRDRFVQVLTEQGVLAVFHGHEHNYSRMLVDETLTPAAAGSLWQIITGGAGGVHYGQQETPWSDRVEAFSILPHVVLIDVAGERVELTAVSISGQIIDEAVLTPLPQGLVLTGDE